MNNSVDWARGIDCIHGLKTSNFWVFWDTQEFPQPVS